MARETDFNELIAEVAAWDNTDGAAAEDWIAFAGGYELAVGYSLVFWPRFVVVEDYVLRAGATVEDVRAWERTVGLNRPAIEAVINHIHVASLHIEASKPSEAQVRYLGRVLKETHTAKLRADFPDRKFTVEFVDEPGLDLLHYELTFWQED